MTILCYHYNYLLQSVNKYKVRPLYKVHSTDLTILLTIVSQCVVMDHLINGELACYNDILAPTCMDQKRATLVSWDAMFVACAI